MDRDYTVVMYRYAVSAVPNRLEGGNARMNPAQALKLTDPTLFGNDAAEDEEKDVFDAYFVPRPEIDDFLSPRSKLAILRAYRGEGKSALIRKAFQTVGSQEAFAVKATGSSLAPNVGTVDPDIWTREWKQSVFNRLACEIGANIGMAWNDDAMSLVEEAENDGFRSRSFVSSILSRLKKSPVPLSVQTAGVANPEGVVKRYIEGKQHLWLFVDDLDENFQNTREFKVKIASFFSACRQIVNQVPEIRIRTGIRPNIWTVVRSQQESLGKVDQYLIDLRWDRPLMRVLLAKRIEGYLNRTHVELPKDFSNWEGSYRQEKLIALAFEEEMQWGYDQHRQKVKYRHPWVVMSTLSRFRPRWMVELGKAAASRAVQDGASRISLAHITEELRAFGSQRIRDLSAEYNSLCPQIQDIINAFAGQSEDLTTARLHELIRNRVLQGLNVTISERMNISQPKDIAAMLYEIGFLTARKELENGSYEHYTFAEEPELLHTRTNIDRGMAWEIHPVFRQALGLRTSEGRKPFLKRGIR